MRLDFRKVLFSITILFVKKMINVRYSWGISGILNQNSVNSEFVKGRPRNSRSSLCLVFASVSRCYKYSLKLLLSTQLFTFGFNKLFLFNLVMILLLYEKPLCLLYQVFASRLCINSLLIARFLVSFAILIRLSRHSPWRFLLLY